MEEQPVDPAFERGAKQLGGRIHGPDDEVRVRMGLAEAREGVAVRQGLAVEDDQAACAEGEQSWVNFGGDDARIGRQTGCGQYGAHACNEQRVGRGKYGPAGRRIRSDGLHSRQNLSRKSYESSIANQCCFIVTRL